MSLQQQLADALAQGHAEYALPLAEGLLHDPQGAAIVGKTAAAAWRDFQVAAVIRLIELLKERHVPDEKLNAIRAELKREFELAQVWSKRLVTMQRLRLLAQMRQAVRERRPNDAMRFAQLVAASGKPEQMMPLIGSVLGTCDADIEGARKIGHAISKMLNADVEQAQSLQDGIERRLKSLYEGGAENREREFIAEHIAATVELSKSLPGANDKVKEKDAEAAAVEKFNEQVRSIFACAVRFEDKNYWPDVTRLLMEFLPHHVTATGRLAGVEQRQYESLTFPARKIAALTFKDIGRSEALVDRLIGMTQVAWKVGDSEAAALLELLGSLRNAKAQSLMLQVLTAKDKHDLHGVVVEALGNLGNDRSVEALFNYLRPLTERRPMDLPSKRVAQRVIESLGKIARNPNVDENTRAMVMTKIRQVLPMDEHSLQARAVMEVITPKTVARLDQNTRKWAAIMLTEELWVPDQQVAGGPVAEPGQAAPSPLGSRAKAVDLLAALVPMEAETILAAAEPKALRFSGALMALGEVFAKSPTTNAVRLLDLMIRTAAKHAPGRDGYAQEQVWSAEDDRYVGLTPEPVLESLVYAVIKIAESEERLGEGFGLLERIMKMVRSGELPKLGEKPSQLVLDAHMKLTKLRGAASTRIRTLGGERQQEDAGEPENQKTELHQPEPERPRLHPDEAIALRKILRGGWVFSAPAAKRIAAIQQLSAAGDEESLGTFLELLEDKDAMVAAAAGTALGHFTGGDVPNPVAERATSFMVEQLMRGKPNLQKALRKVLSTVNLMRGPCKKAIVRHLNMNYGPGLAYELSRAMALPSAEEVMKRFTGKSGAEAADEPIAASAPPAPGAPSGAQPIVMPGSSKAPSLDEKRRLLEARRAWIAGGKKGPEPK